MTVNDSTLQSPLLADVLTTLKPNSVHLLAAIKHGDRVAIGNALLQLADSVSARRNMMLSAQHDAQRAAQNPVIQG